MSLINLLKKCCRVSLFTTPSHSQHFFIYNKLRNLYKLDISETEVHNPQRALAFAEHKAADVYGTRKTKFLTNGSSSGIIAAVLSCVQKGDNVLIWRDAHPCHKNAVELAGAVPIYYDVDLDVEWGVPTKVSVEMIRQLLSANKVKALLITSPTYEGFASDIKAIKQVCDEYGVILIVDEAHGALYPFSDRLPQSAVKIAGFTIQSLHKTAGGLNPTALLHTNTDYDVDSALQKISTTSPSYPLLASIEANIAFLNSRRGKKLLSHLLDNITDLKMECNNCDFGGDDITKILVKAAGMSGFELSEKLFEKYKIEDEKTNEVSTMLLCGIGTTQKKIQRLKAALKSIDK